MAIRGKLVYKLSILLFLVLFLRSVKHLPILEFFSHLLASVSSWNTLLDHCHWCLFSQAHSHFSHCCNTTSNKGNPPKRSIYLLIVWAYIIVPPWWERHDGRSLRWQEHGGRSMVAVTLHQVRKQREMNALVHIHFFHVFIVNPTQ